jgi:hypothetical protein
MSTVPGYIAVGWNLSRDSCAVAGLSRSANSDYELAITNLSGSFIYEIFIDSVRVSV